MKCSRWDYFDSHRDKASLQGSYRSYRATSVGNSLRVSSPSHSCMTLIFVLQPHIKSMPTKDSTNYLLFMLILSFFLVETASTRSTSRAIVYVLMLNQSHNSAASGAPHLTDLVLFFFLFFLLFNMLSKCPETQIFSG